MRTFDIICLSIVAGVILFVLAIELLNWMFKPKNHE